MTSSAYQKCPFDFQPESPRDREQLLRVQLHERSLRCRGRWALRAVLLSAHRMQLLPLLQSEKGRNEVKEKQTHPSSSSACLGTEANTRLLSGAAEFSVRAGHCRAAAGVEETLTPGWRLRLLIPLPSPQSLESFWLQQLRKQNKMQFTSIRRGRRRGSWPLEVLAGNWSHRERTARLWRRLRGGFSLDPSPA